MNRLIFILAALVTAAVAIIYVTPKFVVDAEIFDLLPAVNASINGTVAVLLVIGFMFIRKGNRKAHQRVMFTAFVLSALFLVSYVLYHTTHESTAYGGEGWIRMVYFFILLTHIILAIAIVPLVLMSLSKAFSERFDQHRKIAKITLPIWLYVSITGVIVYLMISPYY